MKGGGRRRGIPVRSSPAVDRPPARVQTLLRPFAQPQNTLIPSRRRLPYHTRAEQGRTEQTREEQRICSRKQNDRASVYKEQRDIVE